MLSSSTTLKVSFDIAIKLIPGKHSDVIYLPMEDYQVDTWNIALRLPEHEPKFGDPPVPYELVGPNFDFADVAAGLPKVKAAIDELEPDTSLTRKSDAVEVRVDVQGGISSGERVLFAKKFTTLVMVLEEYLLCKLSAQHCKPLFSRKSHLAVKPLPQGNVVNSDYHSHIPPMVTMKPAVWNNQEPERMYRKFSLIWAAPSLRDIDYICQSRSKACGFFVCNTEEIPRDLEESHTYFCFTSLRPTFEHKLLRNWVEVIARIAELALASSDEYKRCLETIFMILHEYSSGFTAWEQLMKRVLNLEHRIPDWRDEIPQSLQ
ncbi:hypothetical protein LCI18_002695 [Fusarium solani-melongenae]|uniref:Uncharacterized protein n=1 Tax=Fusarium solani subsp. cucurbitae TaxID=2747967 RepID=A0ACD3YS52_FUSSC|nr:hypothetical protein LCI18_002695 [Fusarium solani-melongenae]